MTRIPVIQPNIVKGYIEEIVDGDLYTTYPQPIMELRELEPDKMRYDAWKKGIAKTPRKVKR